MDSDESGHSESEFYYPEGETSKQMTPINLFPDFKKKKSKKKNMLFTGLGRSVQFFPILTYRPVNKIYVLCDMLVELS